MEDKDQLYKYVHPGGRPAKFKTPEELWECACKYFAWVDSHAWEKPELIKSGADAGKVINVPLKLPYTLEGFMVFANLNDAYLRQLKTDKAKEFSTIIDKIYKVVETQQLSGATVGVFNHHIVARKLGLVEKTTISTPEGEEIKVNTINEHRVIFENYDETNV